MNQNEHVLTDGGNVINLDELVALVKHGNDRRRTCMRGKNTMSDEPPPPAASYAALEQHTFKMKFKIGM